MPMTYHSSLATAGNSTTSGSTNTEVDMAFLKAGSTLGFAVMALDLIGKGAGLTALTGIGIRARRYGTASTAGTGFTPQPADAGMQAAVTTGASLPTAGSTVTERFRTGCGATTGGGWWAKTDDEKIRVRATAMSFDILSVSGTASMNFEWSLTHEE